MGNCGNWCVVVAFVVMVNWIVLANPRLSSRQTDETF